VPGLEDSRLHAQWVVRNIESNFIGLIPAEKRAYIGQWTCRKIEVVVQLVAELGGESLVKLLEDPLLPRWIKVVVESNEQEMAQRRAQQLRKQRRKAAELKISRPSLKQANRAPAKGKAEEVYSGWERESCLPAVTFLNFEVFSIKKPHNYMQSEPVKEVQILPLA
jgi:hypothetical protein